MLLYVCLTICYASLLVPVFLSVNEVKQNICINPIAFRMAKTLWKPTQLSPRSHPRHLMGKKTAQKEAIKHITSDSQVNSHFPYRWSPASLTSVVIYFYLYMYITKITINNRTPHVKSPKSQNRRAALGRPAIKLLGGFN